MSVCTHSEGKSDAVDGVTQHMISVLRTAASISMREALDRPSQATAGYAHNRLLMSMLRWVLVWWLTMVMCVMWGYVARSCQMCALAWRLAPKMTRWWKEACGCRRTVASTEPRVGSGLH